MSEPTAVRLRHGKTHIDVPLLSSMTVKDFLTEVEKLTGVPASRQFIVSRRKGFLKPVEELPPSLSNKELQTTFLLSDPIGPFFTNRINDSYALFGSAEEAQRSAGSDDPAATFEDTQNALKVCSAALVGTGKPLKQPRFTCTYYSEVDSKGIEFPVCGPCAHTCWNMQHIVLDTTDLRTLAEPFSCQCCNIVKFDHTCYWKGCDCDDRELAARAEEAWKAEQRHLIRSIRSEAVAKQRAEKKKQEEKFTQKLKSQLQFTQQYYDPVAQAAAVQVVPLGKLHEKAKAAAENGSVTPDAIFQQLLHWFKHEFFSWVNNPKCHCGVDTTSAGSAGPTPEESANWAGVIELYHCPQCQSIVRFPRYNRAQKLLSTRKGRCGEWANCFALIAVSLGYEVRFVVDFTDHVWVEMYSVTMKRWVHCDPCENAFDSPHMYESGWGKKLTYAFAFSNEEVVDVIRRYSAIPLNLKRDAVEESFVNYLVWSLNEEQLWKAPAARIPFLLQRRAEEGEDLALVRRFTQGAVTGRTTGSVQWRLQRGELGSTLPAVSAALPQSSDNSLLDQLSLLTCDPTSVVFSPLVERIANTMALKIPPFEYVKLAEQIDSREGFELRLIAEIQTHASETEHLLMKAIVSDVVEVSVAANGKVTISHPDWDKSIKERKRLPATAQFELIEWFCVYGPDKEERSEICLSLSLDQQGALVISVGNVQKAMMARISKIPPACSVAVHGGEVLLKKVELSCLYSEV